MPRPRKPDDQVTPAALAKRRQRERKAGKLLRPILDAVDVTCVDGFTVVTETSRLVLHSNWIPKGDEKAADVFAQRLRKAARIPETEVPE